MGSAPRLAAALGAAAVVLVACSGSLADADSPDPAPTRRSAPTDPFCAAVTAASEARAPLLAVDSGRPADVAAVVQAVRRTNTELLATAPGEIRTDVEQVVSVSNLHLEVLESADGDPFAAARHPQLNERRSTPEFRAANSRVQAFVEKNCPGP